ncbi:hypothetical protein JBO09_28020, partial [Pseudomonas sp. PAMC 26818]|uniref:hypothetical protein n=1 Tax=Pseudomonas sp. PAMC 26818 TaxID=1349569 RepID=UPI001C6624A5
IDRLQPVFDSLLDNTSNLNDRTLQTQLRNTGIEISPKAKQEAQAELKQALEVIAHPESLRQETRYEQLTTQLGSGYADPYSTTNMFAYFH